jgi:succinoglycan biosynthesis transport protein ExoP
MGLEYSELKKYLSMMLKRKYLFIALSAIIMSVIVWGGYLLPKKYKAESMVFIERSVIKDLVQGIAVNPSIDQRIRVLRYAMLSRANILKVLKALDRDTQVKNKQELEELIKYFQARTQINIKGNDLFIVSLVDSDPKFARDYINTLVRKYVEEVVSAKREESYGANRFLNEQVAFFKEKLDNVEDKIIKFRQQQGIYVAADERTVIEEIKEHKRDINAIAMKKEELQSVIDILKKQIDIVEPVTVATYKLSGTDQNRISALEKRIKALLTRYTEKHPEVVTLKAELEALKKQGPEPSETESGMEPETSTANPVYQELEQKLYATEAELQALNTRQKKLEALVKTKENQLENIPENKKVLATLERERASRKELYNKLLERQGRAWVSKEMEIEDKSATFKIVDPAVLPEKPTSPNMKKVILMGIFLAFVGGFGGVFVREQFDSSVKDTGTIKELGMPVLAVIPAIFNKAENTKQKRRELFVFTVAGLYFMVICSALVMEMLGITYIDALFQKLPVEKFMEAVKNAGQIYLGGHGL